MKKNVFLVLCAVQFGIVSSANAQEESLTELLEVSLSELMQFDVILASGVEEPLIDAPAAMIVITKREIHQRGYIGLHEVLMDLPGFDVSVTNGTIYLTAYQRGYRTPQTQRTLLMIDGKIENHLWSQVAHFSRQYPVSNIDKIEVLYGPASAIYGPNAFLGVINVYTKNGKGLEDGQTTTEIDLLSGNFDTRSVDATTRGRFGDVDYAISGRVYKSDEPDLSDRWGFNTNTLYGSRSIWGPVLDFDNAGKVLGTYHDPTDDYGLQGSVGYKELRIGLLKWKTREGYGVYYPADRAQNNAFWENTSTHWFAEYDKELSENLRGYSELTYRANYIGGMWAEAFPDWNPNKDRESFISLTLWNSVSNSWLFHQNIQMQLTDTKHIHAGIKFERKDLTMAYDVPGYWDAFSSTTSSDDSGPHGQGAHIGHSSDTTYVLPPPPNPNMPPTNRILTEDVLDDKALSTALRKIAKQKKVKGKTLSIVDQVSVREPLSDCQILFISTAWKDQLKDILQRAENSQVLTVGDTKGFAQQGVAINFVLKGTKLKFEINQKALEGAGLRTNSQLLKLGILVE